MKILAFAGSNSSMSINHQLVTYVASLLNDRDVKVYKMTRYPFPMYSEDAEKNEGFSNSIVELVGDIKKADALLISVNEHNGGLSAYSKNLFDWLSRFDRKFLEGKKIFLMSTSPGRGGARSALAQAQKTLPYFGAEVVNTFSLPSFHQNFKDGSIADADLDAELKAKLEKL